MSTVSQEKMIVEESYYSDNFGHLKDELLKLDLLIKRRVLKFRSYLRTMPRESSRHPMYISHEEVDALLVQRSPDDSYGPEILAIDKELELLQKKIDKKISESENRGVFPVLQRLAFLFGLSRFELQIVVICLAPELDRKYDRLYAYLQDDITRKKPSIDLVLDILCPAEHDRWRARALISGATNLFQAGILRKIDDPQSPSGSSGLSQFLCLDERILSFILGNNSLDIRIVNFAGLENHFPKLEDVPVDKSIKDFLHNFCAGYFARQNQRRKKIVFYLHGPDGAGKNELGRGICGTINRPMLVLDMALLPSNDMLRTAFRESLLHQAVLFISGIDTLFKTQENGEQSIKIIASLIMEFGWLVFLSGGNPWPYQGVFEGALFREIELPLPDPNIRRAAWNRAFKENYIDYEPGLPDRLANRFRLTPGRIRDAAESATLDFYGHTKGIPTLADLSDTCRKQSNRKLGELAFKIEPRYEWTDLVLPENQVDQLNEICNQVRHRSMVLADWGFGRKHRRGRGLSVLFSGPSGAGKTMAAEIIANELGLDLFRIDLSAVVSKYIGETEKNLSKLFDEAETSNAVLFFDEADALFGKRTEVSDAHDRYANIETSYLLQRIEQYEGTVILATNLRENIDEAFTRRLRFIVEFPFPDEASRKTIWRKHLPQQSTVSDKIDFDFLANKFQLAGGNIGNIVLNAAFGAAADEGIIEMKHLLHATRRELEKIGRLWVDEYHYKHTDSMNKSS